jgi:hypothetical protein
VKPIPVPHDWRGLPDPIDSPAGARCPVCLDRIGGRLWDDETGGWVDFPALYVDNLTEFKMFQPCGCTVGPADRES